MKKLFVIAVLLAFTACASYKSTKPAPEQKDTGTGTGTSTETLSDYSKGKAIFEANCGKCHGLDKSFEVSDAELHNVMPNMAAKAGIDSKSQELVHKYLFAARAAQKTK